ncbi:MAG: phytoene/squalene synthase family protein, partial [Rhizobiaceae bacterium]|nr:phytoene/squalene synthase family protein [Rhizobiaceae bacterium]
MHQPSQPDAFSTPANCADCRWSIRQGSQSFYLASLLLPVAIREPAYAVYAFCRTADDLIDREQGGAEAIRELGTMLDRIYAGRPGSSFVERGFADVVSRFAIPRQVPEALIEGLAWDAASRRYDSLDDLKAYAVRVAGTVGLMMTLVMGRREPQVLARACDLGVAMQLTNIARDIGEDAANGRIYLPLDWMREAGIEPEAWRARPASTPVLRKLVERLLFESQAFYDRSGAGIAGLPGSCRIGINTARLLYREIG